MKKTIDEIIEERKYPHTYTFKLEWVMALLQGKRIELSDGLNSERFVFYPPQGGIFMTHEEYHTLKMKFLTDMAFTPEALVSQIQEDVMDTGVIAQLSRMTDTDMKRVIEKAKFLRDK